MLITQAAELPLQLFRVLPHNSLNVLELGCYLVLERPSLQFELGNALSNLLIDLHCLSHRWVDHLVD